MAEGNVALQKFVKIRQEVDQLLCLSKECLKEGLGNEVEKALWDEYPDYEFLEDQIDDLEGAHHILAQGCEIIKSLEENNKKIREAKANKNAELLLKEIDQEKTREKNKKLAAQRKRQKKKQKRIGKKNLAAGTEKFPDANDIEAEFKSEESEEKLICDHVPNEDTIIESKPQRKSNIKSKSVIEKELQDSEIKEVQVVNDNNSNKEQKHLKQDTSHKNVPKPTTQSEMTLKKVITSKSSKVVTFEDVIEIESEIKKYFKIKRSGLTNTSNQVDNSCQRTKRKENTEDLNPIRHDQIRATNNLNKPVAVSKNSCHKQDDDWQEVARRARKVMVPANTISRVIGRNGTNINTIRDISGAHIEIEKQIKSHTDRSILIRGSPESIKQASRLISELVADLNRDVADLIPRSMEKSTSSSTLIFTRSNSVATTSVGNLSGSQVKPKIVPSESQIGNSSLPVNSTIGLITGSQCWQPSSRKSQSKSLPPLATAIADKDSGELPNPGAPSIPSLTSNNPVIPSCSQVEVTMSENKDSEVTKEWIKEKEEMKRGMDFASVAATGLLSQASSNVKTTPCHSSSSFDASKAPGYRGIFSSISNLMSSDMDLNMPYEFVPPYSNQITSLSHIGNTSASLTNTPVSVPIRVHNQAITPLFTTPKVSPCSTRVPTVVSQSLLTSCGYYPRILPTTSSFSAQSAPKVIVTCREAIVTRNVVSSAYGNSTISSLISSFSREFSTPLCGRGVVFSNPVSSSRGTLLAGTDSQRSEFEFETSSQPNNPISTYTTASLPQLVSSTGPIQSKLNPNAPDFSVRISNYAPSESQSVVPDESNINVNSDTAAVGGRNTYVKLPYPMPAPGYVMGHNPYGTNMEKMNYKDNESQQPSSYFTSTSTDLLNEECPPLLSDSIRDLVVPRLIGMERGLVTNQDSSYNQQFWPATDMYNSNISNPPPSEWSSYENHSKQVDYTDADSNDKEKTISRGKRTNKILFLKGVKNIKQVPAHYISDTSRENHPSNAADAGQTKFSSWGRPRRH